MAGKSPIAKFQRETLGQIRDRVKKKFPDPQAREPTFSRVFEAALHRAEGDDGTWWRKMGKLGNPIVTQIGTLMQLVYMLTAFGAPGQLWHVDRNPITTTRRDVGFGILALGDANARKKKCIQDAARNLLETEGEGKPRKPHGVHPRRKKF